MIGGARLGLKAPLVKATIKRLHWLNDRWCPFGMDARCYGAGHASAEQRLNGRGCPFGMDAGYFGKLSRPQNTGINGLWCPFKARKYSENRSPSSAIAFIECPVFPLLRVEDGYASSKNMQGSYPKSIMSRPLLIISDSPTNTHF